MAAVRQQVCTMKVRNTAQRSDRMKEHQRLIGKIAWHRLPREDKDAYNRAVRLWNEEATERRRQNPIEFLHRLRLCN